MPRVPGALQALAKRAEPLQGTTRTAFARFSTAALTRFGEAGHLALAGPREGLPSVQAHAAEVQDITAGDGKAWQGQWGKAADQDLASHSAGEARQAKAAACSGDSARIATTKRTVVEYRKRHSILPPWHKLLCAGAASPLSPYYSGPQRRRPCSTPDAAREYMCVRIAVFAGCGGVAVPNQMNAPVCPRHPQWAGSPPPPSAVFGAHGLLHCRSRGQVRSPHVLL